jgi:hypothetical protein
MRPKPSASRVWRSEYGQALRFIVSSGARITEVLHLHADTVSPVEKAGVIACEGGKMHNVRVLEGCAR